MQNAKFAPGFRISLIDVGVLGLGCVLVGASAAFNTLWSIIIGLVVIHFFLFCNVFRIARSLELLWATVFLTFATATELWGVPGWLTTVFVTVSVIIAEMSKPSYHGIGWQRINPLLPEWWEKNAPQARKSEQA